MWRQLSSHATSLETWNYYLAGGTALSLQVGHRRSVDFDFFSQRPRLGEKTFHWLENFRGFILREMDEHTVHAEISGVKISFISNYKYPTIKT